MDQTIHKGHAVDLAVLVHAKRALFVELRLDPLVGISNQKGHGQEGARQKQHKKTAGDFALEKIESDLHSFQ